MTTKTATVRLTKTECAALARRAELAGMAAGEAAVPTPMVVFERENPWDETSPVKRLYAPVAAGVCGFAFVTVRPGTGSFARYAKARLGWRKAYYGGMQTSVFAFGQSLERKTAYARAYAGVLTEAGVPAYVETRMD